MDVTSCNEASRSRMNRYNEEGGGEMSGDVFNDVADVYEAMIAWPKRLANEGRFFRRLFDNGGVSRVVDVACGTGRHGAMFHSWGMDVEGADIGTSMIERARTNVGEQQVHPDVNSDTAWMAVNRSPRMSSFSCPHYTMRDETCGRLKTDCVPGRPGCVLPRTTKFAVPVEERLRKKALEKGERSPDSTT